MATVEFFQAQNMFAPTAWYGTPATWSPLYIQLDNSVQGKPFQKTEYYGNFSFSGSSLNGGVVTRIYEWFDKFHNYDISNIALDALTVEHFLIAGDGVGLQACLYSGDDLVQGSGQNDALRGLAGNDVLFGNAGDDLLQGDGGDDKLYGGEGLDTALYSGVRGGYAISVAKDGEVSVSGGEGGDKLEEVERIHFADVSLAFDVDGHAGQAMGFVGAVAPKLINDVGVRGLILSMLDSGTTMEQLCQLALERNLLPHTSDAELAKSVCHNVLGGAVSAEATDALVGYIESHGQSDFLAAVAGLHLNVDLVGFQQTGVEYLL